MQEDGLLEFTQTPFHDNPANAYSMHQRGY
uniref:Uncharacterized protein n=1 Tax=Nelumbo nucifera TaxID=4432 RepID=A0A822ZZW5_NELNU|nr:TPA_asm: hypothetical protein HUJ06_019008 [Nelumbo nucifera]